MTAAVRRTSATSVQLPDMSPPARFFSCCPGDSDLTLIRTTGNRVSTQQPQSLVEQLLEQMLYQTGHRASPSEQSSWRKSLPAFAIDLVDAGLGEVEMLVETTCR